MSATQVGMLIETRVEFDSVDEMELAEHPTIKGLPREAKNGGRRRWAARKVSPGCAFLTYRTGLPGLFRLQVRSGAPFGRLGTQLSKLPAEDSVTRAALRRYAASGPASRAVQPTPRFRQWH